MSSRDREKERVIEGARERKSGWEEVKAHRLRRMEREREQTDDCRSNSDSGDPC